MQFCENVGGHIVFYPRRSISFVRSQKTKQPPPPPPKKKTKVNKPAKTIQKDKFRMIMILFGLPALQHHSFLPLSRVSRTRKTRQAKELRALQAKQINLLYLPPQREVFSHDFGKCGQPAGNKMASDSQKRSCQTSLKSCSFHIR